MRAVDRAMVEDLLIELIQMMENPGRSLAHLAIARFAPATVTVLAAPGANGGGLVAPRHLVNRGCTVSVVLSELDSVTLVAHQADVLVRMGAVTASAPAPAHLVVDALTGYSLRDDSTGRAAELIEWTNAQAAPLLALDGPSGVDVATGTAAFPGVQPLPRSPWRCPRSG
jgi:NAD(P)H-hydrate epimerase